MSGIITDSSIWQDVEAFESHDMRDSVLRIGQVRSVLLPVKEEDDLLYRVEIMNAGVITHIICSRVVAFGGIYNFQETLYRGYTQSRKNAGFEVKTGDMVLVGFISGDSRQGVILGSLNHSGRKEVLDATKDGIASISVFNGIETKIDNDGQFTQTFKGQPTNLKDLDKAVDGSPIKPAVYDDKIGSSYYTWDKTGSYTLTDNAKEKPIKMKIDKPAGIFTLDVGLSSIKIEKATDTITITNKVSIWKTETSLSITTKDTMIDSSSSFTLKAAKIDTTGKMSQTGDVKVTGKVDITGNLSNMGTASLAGGSYPLIYDIVLIMGTGNLGAPVISTPTMLKTVKTKAT